MDPVQQGAAAVTREPAPLAADRHPDWRLVFTLCCCCLLATVFIQALSRSCLVFWHAISEPDALSALGLTALVTLLLGASEPAVRHRGRFGHRPVPLPRSATADHHHRSAVLGLAGDRRSDVVLLFGSRGWFGDWLSEHDIKIIFAPRDHIWPTTS